VPRKREALRRPSAPPLLLLDLPGEWRPVWVEWAERVTLRRVESDVERALLLRAHHARAWERCRSHPERAQDPMPAGERQMGAAGVDLEAPQALSWRVPSEVARVYLGVRETLCLRLRPERRGWLSDGEVFDAPLDCAILCWTIRDPSSRRPDPVIERDGHRCAVPGCTSRRNPHDHHLVFLSHGGSDAPENRITLCAFHHQRCLHAGLMAVHGRRQARSFGRNAVRISGTDTPPRLHCRAARLRVRAEGRPRS